ncbi:hypothetical protein [Vibrio jasicida]|uniref:hypothetical protein n=1 Tax=Vibrio jasicida TaxID=766224 RepID=UPI0011B038D7|nr:hypothetical protein [Vibrio jasicida]
MKLVSFFMFSVFFFSSVVLGESNINAIISKDVRLKADYDKCILVLSKRGEVYEAKLSSECELSFGVKSILNSICNDTVIDKFKLIVHQGDEEYVSYINKKRVCPKISQSFIEKPKRNQSKTKFTIQLYSGIAPSKMKYECHRFNVSEVKGHRYFYNLMGMYESSSKAKEDLKKLKECGLEAWIRPSTMPLK